MSDYSAPQGSTGAGGAGSSGFATANVQGAVGAHATATGGIGPGGPSGSASVGLDSLGPVDLHGFASVGVKIPPLYNLKLFEMLMPANFVVFDHNPKSFSVEKKALVAERPQPAASNASGSLPNPTSNAAGGQQITDLGTRATKITFVALLTDEDGSQLTDAAMLGGIGGGVKGRADLLLNWCTVGPSSLLSSLIGMAGSALGLAIQNYYRRPMLVLQWGDPMRGHVMMGQLSSVKVTYKRFDNFGNPLRAEAACVFEEAPLGILSLLTNPTSGGVPGRRGHTVTQGENLQTIATANYGRPGAWRDVADSNGIDDPFRVRPGQQLLLPPPAETGR